MLRTNIIPSHNLLMTKKRKICKEAKGLNMININSSDTLLFKLILRGTLKASQGKEKENSGVEGNSPSKTKW